MNEDRDFDTRCELTKKQVRRTYLVTYSQANVCKFPTSRRFGEQVVAYFNDGSSKVVVEHWACCMEHHENIWCTLPPIPKIQWPQTVEKCQ